MNFTAELKSILNLSLGSSRLKSSLFKNGIVPFFNKVVKAEESVSRMNVLKFVEFLLFILDDRHMASLRQTLIMVFRNHIDDIMAYPDRSYVMMSFLYMYTKYGHDRRTSNYTRVIVPVTSMIILESVSRVFSVQKTYAHLTAFDNFREFIDAGDALDRILGFEYCPEPIYSEFEDFNRIMYIVSQSDDRYAFFEDIIEEMVKCNPWHIIHHLCYRHFSSTDVSVTSDTTT